MAHRFLIKDIALQAGLSTATVDRVINGRDGVRGQTRARVMAAIRALEAQEQQLVMRGRKLLIDVIVEAPQSFLNALSEALATELPLVQSAVFRTRTDLRTRFALDEMLVALTRAQRAESDGVLLMAPNQPAIRDKIAVLQEHGIPVVTLATDMPQSARTGYVGLNNTRAGQVAAWLVRKWAAGAPVLVTKRNDAFHGESARIESFMAALSDHAPALIVERGTTSGFVSDVVAWARAQSVAPAIYSVGGHNRKLLSALDAAGVTPALFIAHDLDPDNHALLEAGKIDALLYHDFAEDIRKATAFFLAAQSGGAIPKSENGTPLRVVFPPMLGAGA